MSATSDGAVDLPIDSLTALLGATEALAASLEKSEDPADWTRLADLRQRAFERFVRALGDPATRTALLAVPVARASLDRIRELDAALLETGRAELARLARERLEVVGRRRGVLAHGDRVREAPRAVTIKA